MELEVLEDPETLGARASSLVAAASRAAITARGIFTLALSGGRTPEPMLRALAREAIEWRVVHVFQVDERVAPAGSAERNLTQLATLPAPNLHAMPVEDADLDSAARRYARELARFAGEPPVLDVIHLGLGADGHTASLVPGDAALDETTLAVAKTGVYQGRHRMTLTFPVLDRARNVFWLVSGADKRAALARLLDGDRGIPAGRVSQARARVLADRAAAGSAARG